MTMEKDILGIVPGLQATALVGENLKLFNVGKNGKTPKISSGKLIKTGVTNMIGVGLISGTSKMINSI